MLESLPELPPGLAYVWDWYNELAAGLDSGGMGAPRLTWHALQAWQQCTGTTCQPWEIACLQAIHSEFLAADRQAQNSKKISQK